MKHRKLPDTVPVLRRGISDYSKFIDEATDVWKRLLGWRKVNRGDVRVKSPSGPSTAQAAGTVGLLSKTFSIFLKFFI